MSPPRGLSWDCIMEWDDVFPWFTLAILGALGLAVKSSRQAHALRAGLDTLTDLGLRQPVGASAGRELAGVARRVGARSRRRFSRQAVDRLRSLDPVGARRARRAARGRPGAWRRLGGAARTGARARRDHSLLRTAGPCRGWCG